jgi:hypothetical protein
MPRNLSWGYGINGIGFKPTASIAWERSQKRQKQVAEWKNRDCAAMLASLAIEFHSLLNCTFVYAAQFILANTILS